MWGLFRQGRDGAVDAAQGALSLSPSKTRRNSILETHGHSHKHHGQGHHRAASLRNKVDPGNAQMKDHQKRV